MTRLGIARVLHRLSTGLLLALPTTVNAFATSPATDVLLKARFANLAPTRLQAWLRARPFAAALPIQPMLVVPWELEHGRQAGVDLTFRRKPSSEKGGVDGGLRMSVQLEESRGRGSLTVTRLTEGQYVDKRFSERKLCALLRRDLEGLPASCGTCVSVLDVLDDSVG